jgi:hypothetical protein
VAGKSIQAKEVKELRGHGIERFIYTAVEWLRTLSGVVARRVCSPCRIIREER